MSKKRPAKKASQVVKPVGAEPKDNSPFVFQYEKLKSPVNIRQRYALSPKQAVIMEVAADKQSKVIMIDGYWGTGKSSMAVLAGLQSLNDKKTDGIIYIRNSLEATSSGKVGLLPGSLEDRMAPYNAILYDKLNEFLPKSDVDRLKN